MALVIRRRRLWSKQVWTITVAVWIMTGAVTGDSVVAYGDLVEPIFCGGNLSVGIEAKLLRIPKTEEGRPLVCRWLLKTPHPNLNIGLTTATTELSYGPGDYFILEAHDGMTVDSTVLGTVEVDNQLFLGLNWSFEKSIVSSSSYMLLEYRNNGYNPLSVDFYYYTCGGTVDGDIFISSPVFNTDDPINKIVECQWNLTKPPDALYGSIKFLNLNISDCSESVLQICSNGGLKNLENVVPNIIADADSDHKFADEVPVMKKVKLNPVRRSSQDNTTLLCTYDLPDGDKKAHSICGNLINTTVFDGAYALLLYRILEPNTGVGFNARYFPVSVPKRRKSKPVPWYINYICLTIYMPIGMCLGMTVILLQSRRRGPAKSDIKAMSDAILAGDLAPSEEVSDKKPVREMAPNTCKESQVFVPEIKLGQFAKPKVKLKSEDRNSIVYREGKIPKGGILKSVSAKLLTIVPADNQRADTKISDKESAPRDNRHVRFQSLSDSDRSQTM